MTVADFPALTQRRYNKAAPRNRGGLFISGGQKGDCQNPRERLRSTAYSIQNITPNAA